MYLFHNPLDRGNALDCSTQALWGGLEALNKVQSALLNGIDVVMRCRIAKVPNQHLQRRNTLRWQIRALAPPSQHSSIHLNGHTYSLAELLH